MGQGSPRPEGEQGRLRGRGPAATVADIMTLARLPLALAFVLVEGQIPRLGILAVAAGTDLLDGMIARRLGGSRFGAFIDPVADKLFMGAAFLVVLLSGRLAWYEVLGTLLRDAVATVAFVVTLVSGRAKAIPARPGGKAVTVAQVMTLTAFLLDSSWLRPLAWGTAGAALYAIWDYIRAAPVAQRPVGE